MSMTNKEKRRIYDQESRLMMRGFSSYEAEALRSISMTLSRWFEHECNGDIERDETTGKPMRMWETWKGERKGTPVADREAGAMRRLNAIMANHPEFTYYIQTDPRGAALYLVLVDDIKPGISLDCCYSSIGICVY